MSKSNKEKPPDNESTEKTLSRRQIVTGLAALGAVATAASAPMLFPKENESTPKEPESLEVSDHAYEPDAIHCARQCSRIVPGDEVAQALLLICAPEKIAALIEPVSLDSSRSDSLTLDLPYFDGAGVYASPMKVSQYLNAFEAVSGDACDLILHVTLDGGGVSKEIRDRVTANAGAPGICLEGSFSQTEKLLSDFEQLFAVSRNDALHSLFSQVDEALGKAADIEQGSRFTMLPIGGSAGEVGHSEGTAVAKVLELAGVDRFDCRPSYYGTYEFDSVDLVEESAKADLALMLEESAYSDLLAGVISSVGVNRHLPNGLYSACACFWQGLAF